MENPFKSIIVNEKLPEKMKEKVMDDIALIQFSIEVADLVSIKYPETIKNFFGFGEKISSKKEDIKNIKKKD